MHRLLYISTAREPITPALLERVLRSARRNNAASGITGLLVAGGRRFLQVLEGPGEAVVETFENIRRDPRHGAIVKLAQCPVETRAFANWSMGYEAGGAAMAEGPVTTAVATLIALIGEPRSVPISPGPPNPTRRRKR